jgi:hypothetical protein
MEICYREEQDTRRTGRYCSDCMRKTYDPGVGVGYKFMTNASIKGQRISSDLEHAGCTMSVVSR